MVFVDLAKITVRSGAGGDGCVSFRREKYVPRGGPDGGDGGRGGSVYLKAVSKLSTLYDFHAKPLLVAESGGRGGAKNCHGRSGEDLVILIPCGTIVRDARRGHILKDFKEESEAVCVARGGRGGYGNKHFASSLNRAPRKVTSGEPSEERTLLLELKLIGDVGIVGLPNAGKSTLLSRVSSAHPKVASYPFTTLEPQLGVVEVPPNERFVMAEIPGLIEGAHRGVGLGDEFLRHVERTRLLLILLDMSPGGVSPEPDAAYAVLTRELALYSKALPKKAHLVVPTKMDLLGTKERLAQLRKKIRRKMYPISALTGEGLEELISAIRKALKRLSKNKSP